MPSEKWFDFTSDAMAVGAMITEGTSMSLGSGHQHWTLQPLRNGWIRHLESSIRNSIISRRILIGKLKEGIKLMALEPLAFFMAMLAGWRTEVLRPLCFKAKCLMRRVLC